MIHVFLILTLSFISYFAHADESTFKAKADIDLIEVLSKRRGSQQVILRLHYTDSEKNEVDEEAQANRLAQKIQALIPRVCQIWNTDFEAMITLRNALNDGFVLVDLNHKGALRVSEFDDVVSMHLNPHPPTNHVNLH